MRKEERAPNNAHVIQPDIAERMRAADMGPHALAYAENVHAQILAVYALFGVQRLEDLYSAVEGDPGKAMQHRAELSKLSGLVVSLSVSLPGTGVAAAFAASSAAFCAAAASAAFCAAEAVVAGAQKSEKAHQYLDLARYAVSFGRDVDVYLAQVIAAEKEVHSEAGDPEPLSLHRTYATIAEIAASAKLPVDAYIRELRTPEGAIMPEVAPAVLYVAKTSGDTVLHAEATAALSVDEQTVEALQMGNHFDEAYALACRMTDPADRAFVLADLGQAMFFHGGVEDARPVLLHALKDVGRITDRERKKAIAGFVEGKLYSAGLHNEARTLQAPGIPGPADAARRATAAGDFHAAQRALVEVGNSERAPDLTSTLQALVDAMLAANKDPVSVIASFEDVRGQKTANEKGRHLQRIAAMYAKAQHRDMAQKVIRDYIRSEEGGVMARAYIAEDDVRAGTAPDVAFADAAVTRSPGGMYTVIGESMLHCGALDAAKKLLQRLNGTHRIQLQRQCAIAFAAAGRFEEAIALGKDKKVYGLGDVAAEAVRHVRTHKKALDAAMPDASVLV